MRREIDVPVDVIPGMAGEYLSSDQARASCKDWDKWIDELFKDICFHHRGYRLGWIVEGPDGTAAEEAYVPACSKDPHMGEKGYCDVCVFKEWNPVADARRAAQHMLWQAFRAASKRPSVVTRLRLWFECQGHRLAEKESP